MVVVDFRISSLLIWIQRNVHHLLVLGKYFDNFTFVHTPNFSRYIFNFFGGYRARLDDRNIKVRNANKNFYEITFKNRGGLVMPLIIEWTYSDGTKEIENIPAEVWRKRYFQTAVSALNWS